MRSRHFLKLVGLSLLLSLAWPVTTSGQVLAKPDIEENQADETSGLTPLTGEALTAIFHGKTMDGIYKIPRERTGTNKFTESFNEDGTTDYFEGPLVDTGQWIVRGSLICFRYDGALSGGVSCFNVYKSGTCIYSYNPANVRRNGYPVDDNLWSVKTITRGDISTCDDLVS